MAAQPEDDEGKRGEARGEASRGARGEARSEEWEELLLGVLAEGEGSDVGGEPGDSGTLGDTETLGDTGTLGEAKGEEAPGAVVLLRAALAGIGLDAEAVASWTGVLCAQVAADGTEGEGVPVPETDLAIVDAMKDLARTRHGLEASTLVWVQDLVLSAGSRLLAQRGVTDPRTMSKTAHQTWRVNVKSAVAGELQVGLGVGVGEARQLVAVATYPAPIRAHVLEAMRRGEVSWRLVRAFQRETRRLEVQQAARVSKVLFGADGQVAAVERLDADGQLELGRPWHHAEYYAALKREVALVKAEDEDSAEDERAAAMESRDARMQIGDDGLATLTVTMGTAPGVSVMNRIEDMARRARKGGDPRTLGQLRSDIVTLLLMHGIVLLPGDRQCGCPDTEEAPDSEETPDREEAPTDSPLDEVITPDDVAALRAIITATPAAHVDMVIPWDAVLGAVCAHCRQAVVGTGPEPDRPPGSTAEGESSAQPQEDEPLSPDCYHGRPRGDGDEQPGACTPAIDAPPPTRVAELIGWETAFITPREARQLILTPGSRVGRLLTDQADGRCLERSIQRYAPDADMRRQILAADVYGRGPGCRRPARQCEVDHELEWLTHGWTAEPNLNSKAKLDHVRKTKKLWRSMMNRRRDVTWTTLLGQIATTRGHDYRQYVERVESLTPLGGGGGVGASDDSGVPQERSDLAARRDLVNQLVYAALVHRGAGQRAEADDDVVDSEDWLTIGDWGHLHHTDAAGQRRPGGPPDQPTPEELLDLSDPAPGGEGPTAGPWASTMRRRPEEDPPPF